MKTKRLCKSLFSKYSLAFVTVILISFLLLIVVVNLVLRDYYMEKQKEELARLAASGCDLVEIDYRYEKENGYEDWLSDTENQKWLWVRVTALHNQTDMFLVVTLPSGKIVYDSDVPLHQTTFSFALTDTINKTGVASGISDGEVFDELHYFYGKAIVVEGVHVASVYACVPLSQVHEPIAAVMKMIAISCLCVMLAAVVVAYFVSERITKPLANMSKAAKAFSDGDFTVRVPVRGGNEISEFATVFNEMAENLENMDKTRNDFIANVSHDLRSPMTSITGFVDGMLNGVIPPEKHDHYLRIVLNETKRLSRLVAALLDISKIQAGERKFRMMNFDICEMARQIIISFENRIEEKNLYVTFDAEADRIFVRADMDAIYQVLYNLCDNATKFAYDEKNFAIYIQDKGNSVLVRVYNEGIGIAEEDIKHVFDRFYKGDKSRGMDKTGTGLGLYISKKIIEAHKQKIGVESTYGEYCCFHFTLEKGKRPTRGRGFEQE